MECCVPWRFMSFKFFGHILKQLADGQMLRTDVFTISAADAAAGLAAVGSVDIPVIVFGVPVMELHSGVHAGK